MPGHRGPATAPPPPPPPAGPSVQVTKERVVAPPERFISVQDDKLLEYFSGLLGAEETDSSLPALYSLLEGVCQHEFLALRRRLEANFAFFSAAGQGVRLDKGKGRLQRLSSIEDNERRFLRDFISAMHSSHYRLLGNMEWEAALAEAFLFTLPVTVDWGALDKRMLQRFWGDHPVERQRLPDLSDRILIFHRGFQPAKMRGRYLMQKTELLITFYLITPLWVALVMVLERVGLKAPPPPPIAHMGHKRPEVTFRAVGTAAKAAMKWRRAAQGELEEDESLMHDACTIIERKTMSRHFPSGWSVMSRFFEVVELQEACFRDVVVLFRRKVPKEAGGEGEKQILREAADPAVLGRNIYIKQFTGIPLADLEMVMPEKKVFVPPSVFVQLVVAALAAVIGLLATFFQAHLDWKVWWWALVMLASRASQCYFQASSERNEIEREMNKLLFERTVASQEAVLHTLTDEMCRQHIREIFLCYCCLLHSGKDLQDEDLDTKCERLLRKHFGLRLDFTAEQAIPPLCRWGLASRQPDGRLRAQPLRAALASLDTVWDGIYSFSRGSGTGSGSNGEARGEVGGSGREGKSYEVASREPGMMGCSQASEAAAAAESCGDERSPCVLSALSEEGSVDAGSAAEVLAGPVEDEGALAAEPGAVEAHVVVLEGIAEAEAPDVQAAEPVPEASVSEQADGSGFASRAEQASEEEEAGQQTQVVAPCHVPDSQAASAAELEAADEDTAAANELASMADWLPLAAGAPSAEAEVRAIEGMASLELAGVAASEAEAIPDDAELAAGGAELEEPPPASVSAESSSSSLEYITLRIPTSPATAALGASRAAFKRSPSSKISARHLHHLDSLRRQRQQQQAAGASSPPPKMLLVAAAAVSVGACRPASDCQLAGTQPGQELTSDCIAAQAGAGGGLRSRVQGSPGSRSASRPGSASAGRSSGGKGAARAGIVAGRWSPGGRQK